MTDRFENMRLSVWFPRKALAPVFERYEEYGEMVLGIYSGENKNSYGKWMCLAEDICAGAVYSFSVQYRPENVVFENKCIYMLISWNNAEDQPLQRDYACNISDAGNGWRSLQGTFRAPSGAVSLTVELALRWCAGASVSWKKLAVEKLPQPERRLVKAATVYMESQRSLEANKEAFLKAADKAGRLKPDIICFTESVISNLVDLPLEQKCQPVPGDLTAMAGEKARLYNTYIILPMYERDGGLIYNSAVLIGRDGEVKGKYRKVHISLAEAEAGITPGDEYGIFDTDFGRIGIMICWDQAFPEAARILRLNGAEIVFLPTYGEEPLQQMARARDNGVYVIVSGMYGPQSSRIINPLGEISAKVDSVDEAVCVKEIDLDEKFYTWWLSVGPCNGEPRSLYIKERRNDTYGKLL